MEVEDRHQRKRQCAHITDDDILADSLSISMNGGSDLSNKVIVKYVGKHDFWIPAQVEINKDDLQTLDGQILEKTLDIKGIIDRQQAGQMAEISLNSMRYSEDSGGTRMAQTPLTLAFATSIKNAHLEVGDVISIDHSILDRVRRFLILSIETDQSGLIQVVSREYCDTHYMDQDGQYLI